MVGVAGEIALPVIVIGTLFVASGRRVDPEVQYDDRAPAGATQ